MTSTMDKDKAATIWVSGVMAAEATVDFKAKRRKTKANCLNRATWCSCPPCKRTTRWASTFSSTT